MDIELVLSTLLNSGWVGAWLFFLLNFIESAPVLGSFLPSGTILYIGGLLASHGTISFTKLVIFASAGSALGDHAVYLLGRWGRTWFRSPSTEKNLIEKGENFFTRYGDKSILIGRFTGPVRAAIPLAAGTARMSHLRFFGWNLFSSVVWTVVYAGLGFYSGNIIIIFIREWSDRLELIIGVAAVIAIAYWLLKKHGRKLPAFLQKLLNRPERQFVGIIVAAAILALLYVLSR